MDRLAGFHRIEFVLQPRTSKQEQESMNSYVFILCPPYCGSTLLWKLVLTSTVVSALPSEGQFLPEVKEIMRQDPWNVNVKLPWVKIKEVWDGYWDHNKLLLLEKSPPNLIRAKEIEQHFNPVYFLLMVRNPYAHCEGLIRHNKQNAKEAAEFTVRCLKQQAENAVNLKEALCFTYENLVGDPGSISRKIKSFIPEIGELKYDDKFRVHSIDGIVEREITDLNQKKIYNLSNNDLKQINGILIHHPDIMDYWGYKYYEPSLRHALSHFKTRSGLAVTTIPHKANRFIARVTERLTKQI
ncbi:MAG: hypothetical protein ACP5D6_10625 [Kosmotogaceae bacterium]